ncbi:Nuclear control of ATPase protein 2 [Rhizoclosmatium sp. JEL0117]|nr:Nuclear control of ATPase protein 2 [Rhizoclosmatium sp. JEL0117]
MEGIRQQLLATALSTESPTSREWVLLHALDRVQGQGQAEEQSVVAAETIKAVLDDVLGSMAADASFEVSAVESIVLGAALAQIHALLRSTVLVAALQTSNAALFHCSRLNSDAALLSHALTIAATDPALAPGLAIRFRAMQWSTVECIRDNLYHVTHAPLHWARRDLRAKVAALKLAQFRNASVLGILATQIHAHNEGSSSIAVAPLDSLSLLEDIASTLVSLPADAVKVAQFTESHPHHQPPVFEPLEFDSLLTLNPAPTPYSSSPAPFSSASASGTIKRKQSLKPPVRPSSDMRSRYERALKLLDTLETLESSFYVVQKEYGTPSLFKQYLVPSIATLSAGLFIFGSVRINLESIRGLITSATETAMSLAQDYFLTPLQQVYSTIRHKERRLALMGADSLSSDLESLERMVVDFAKDRHLGANDSDIREMVQRGDLSIVLKSYESDLKHPISQAVRGDLIRTLLIQVQKSKVDLELAMSALDKLLAANELNFTIMSVVPILFLSYAAYTSARTFLRRRNGLGREQVYEKIRLSLGHVERILNRANNGGRIDEVGGVLQGLSFEEYGLLLIELSSLGTLGQAVPRKWRDRFLEDVVELGDVKWSVAQRLETVKRITRWYPFVQPKE